MRAVDFFSQGKPGRVEEPHTFDELDKLTHDERRQLISQREADGRSPRFNAEAWRAQQREQGNE